MCYFLLQPHLALSLHYLRSLPSVHLWIYSVSPYWAFQYTKFRWLRRKRWKYAPNGQKVQNWMGQMYADPMRNAKWLIGLRRGNTDKLLIKLTEQAFRQMQLGEVREGSRSRQLNVWGEGKNNTAGAEGGRQWLTRSKEAMWFPQLSGLRVLLVQFLPSGPQGLGEKKARSNPCWPLILPSRGGPMCHPRSSRFENEHWGELWLCTEQNSEKMKEERITLRGLNYLSISWLSWDLPHLDWIPAVFHKSES